VSQEISRDRERVFVHAAPLALRSWCLCAIVRNVRAGPVQARIQASTWATLNLVVDGEVRGPHGVLPRGFLTAPFAAPFETSTPGPLLSISLVLQPWALEPLTGTPAGAVGPLPLAWPSPARGRLRAIDHAMHDACTSGNPSHLWSALEAHGREVQEAQPCLALETLLGAGVAAAAEALGCSTRQYLRRFRHAMGLSPATWLRIRRWETALRAMAGAPHDSMAQLSLQQGFADQAHLARETRALVAETPIRLRRLLLEDAGPWSLRPAHVRFVQDEGDLPA
jgi:AraC-like DNA-binding protein